MISDAEKVYRALLAKYPEAMQEITLLSKDTSGNKDFVISLVKAFNFDLVSNCHHGAKPEKEKSPDALFIHEGALNFVEFKSGKPDADGMKNDIRLKIHEAILTLYKFAIQEALLDRQAFLSLPINYVVILRPKQSQQKVSSFADPLRRSFAQFNLKNMEGFLIGNAATFTRPQAIVECLWKLSHGEIKRIEIVSIDQRQREIVEASGR